jgi:hypothetical protein
MVNRQSFMGVLKQLLLVVFFAEKYLCMLEEFTLFYLTIIEVINIKLHFILLISFVLDIFMKKVNNIGILWCGR